MWEVCHPIDVDLLACVYLGWLMSSRVFFLSWRAHPHNQPIVFADRKQAPEPETPKGVLRAWACNEFRMSDFWGLKLGSASSEHADRKSQILQVSSGC